ncbi:hypothetical protein MVEG_11828 [Podila verticillata NRRL 6337]|uniref:Uncharacterized protein n=1 Tax=Podila verticillata NRRL 6337 TaxID=1069443 RepID=A0A086TJR3_9FUNG|nr:hypothetical protein MVEG_11828 [Podila verticillata NRRL 6337]
MSSPLHQHPKQLPHHYQHHYQQNQIVEQQLGDTRLATHSLSNVSRNNSATRQPQSYTIYPDPPLRQPPSPTFAALAPFATTPSPSQFPNTPKRPRQPPRSYSDLTPSSSAPSSASSFVSSVSSIPTTRSYHHIMASATRSMSAGTLVSNPPVARPSFNKAQDWSRTNQILATPTQRSPSSSPASPASPTFSVPSSLSNVTNAYIAPSMGSIQVEGRQHEQIYTQRPPLIQKPAISTEERYGGPVRHTGPSKQRTPGTPNGPPLSVQSQFHPQMTHLSGSTSAPSTPTRQRQDSAPKLPPLSFEKEALQYQLKLQQKPPRDGQMGNDEDEDDDSDAGSIISYRRSIQRLSITYKRPNGVPNISLFTPSQRPAVSEHEKSNMHRDGSKGQQPYSAPGERTTGKSSGAYAGLRPDGRVIPDRAGSLDSITQKQRHQPPSTSEYQQNAPKPLSTRSRSNTAGPALTDHHQHQHQHNHAVPTLASAVHASNRNLAIAAAASMRSPSGSPRPSHESSQSQGSQYGRRVDHLTLPSNEFRQGRSATAHGSESRSKSLGRQPMSGGDSYSQVPMRSGGGGGQGPSRVPPMPHLSRPGGFNFNPHPAHHLASGGYVRPEEAVGPSNPTPEKAEDFVRQGIDFHEIGEITKATQYFRSAAEMGDPVGMLMYGLSVRHGWGCAANRPLAFQYLQKSAEHAVGDLKSRDSFASTAAKGELVLAIYELGICFRHGWGVEKNKKTAAYYFEIAANLGDPDAQNDLAWCYYHGVGVKKDMFKSAKYYRLAAAQGLSLMGNSWIWKDKYGGVPPLPSPKSPKSPGPKSPGISMGEKSPFSQSLRAPF